LDAKAFVDFVTTVIVMCRNGNFVFILAQELSLSFRFVCREHSTNFTKSSALAVLLQVVAMQLPSIDFFISVRGLLGVRGTHLRFQTQSIKIQRMAGF
jgi:hypothetical protein